MFFGGLISLVMAILDEKNTRKQMRDNKVASQKRVTTWQNNMRQLKELQNKKYY